MSQWKNRLNNWLVKNIELPADVVMDLPRITLIGQLHIYIENHNGVVAFSNEELRLYLNQGQLLIKGSGFILKTILPEEILLEGQIDFVQFLEK